MSKVILVIGSVTAAQYEYVRLEFLREGHKPKIVRKTKEQVFFSAQELIDIATFDEKVALERLEQIESTDDEAEDESFGIFLGIAKRHLQSLGPVDAVIFDEDAWEWLSMGGWFVKNALETETDEPVTRWVVRNGSIEFIG
jgi:hypothetical protein